MDILNPKLFDEQNMLLSKVREALLDVANKFLQDVEEDTDIEVPIFDIILVGSNASYNYTEYSDIDIHIVTDLSEISQCDPELAGKLMNSERYIFNQNYDIEIADMEAEIYVEDINANTISNGIYSILDDKWIKYPQPIDCVEIDITNDPDYVTIKNYIGLYLEDKADYYTSEEIQQLIDELYLMRKYSLAKDGEYGVGNLIFKEIRNSGLLDELKDKVYELRSEELSY